MALRIRATNDNRVTESFTAEHRLALPPLYRINVGKQTYWALDDADRARILA